MVKVYAQNVRGGGGVPLLAYVLQKFSEASMLSEVHYDNSVVLERRPGVTFYKYDKLYDKVMSFLKKDFNEYGINLVMLNSSISRLSFSAFK